MRRESFFTDDSMVRRCIASSPGPGRPRALLMQAAHPLASPGCFAHSSSSTSPTTAWPAPPQVMDTDRVRLAARRPTRTTRARAGDAPPGARRPGRAGGALRRPGRPTRADDPELLLWVLAMPRRLRRCWSTSATWRRCRPTSATRYWQDYRVIGGLFGLRRRRHARRLRGLSRVHGRRCVAGDTLHVTPEARELARARS